MAFVSHAALAHHIETGITIRQLEQLLKPETATTLRNLMHVLNGPEDAPRLQTALESVFKAVQSYEATLSKPSKTFELVKNNLEYLCEDAAAVFERFPISAHLDQPLLRRLTAHAPYALCLTLAALRDADIGAAREATGLEIALGLATAKRFHSGFANQIRRTLTPELLATRKNVFGRPADWPNQYVKMRVKAAKLFEDGGDSDPEGTGDVRLFDIGAGFELSRKMRYAAPRQRQALLDRRHQTFMQLQASASALMMRAISYDQTALLTLVAFSSGLTLRLTKEIPLASRGDENDWMMVLDVDAGTIKTNLDSLFPGAAMPLGYDKCFRSANRIAVKPLPARLATILKELFAHNSWARTLAELLPEASTSGRQLTLPDNTSVLAPSAKRFLISAAPLAVQLGIDRLAAALLTNDFSVVPSSKLYYCRVRRTEIWEASAALFEALGWGAPAPLQTGLPVGSCIVPRREAISAWWCWMAEEISALTPGRHCGLTRLLTFHNAYARLCASFSVLCLAAREAGELRFTTHNLRAEARFSSFVDKHVGIFPGEVRVPINELLRRQLKFWMAHCQALQRRLKRMSDSPAKDLMRMLDGYLSGVSRALYFEIDVIRCRPIPLGSATLVRWWPEALRFTSDFGRHFWEVELRDAKVRSSRIDVLLRHITLGVEAHCSTNADRLKDIAAEICFTQERLLEALGVQPVPELNSKI